MPHRRFCLHENWFVSFWYVSSPYALHDAHSRLAEALPLKVTYWPA